MLDVDTQTSLVTLRCKLPMCGTKCLSSGHVEVLAVQCTANQGDSFITGTNRQSRKESSLEL